jgi:hypothetical protein
MTDRSLRYQRRLREKGLCPHCRKPLEINPRTGWHYQWCADERERRRLVERARREKKGKVPIN